jgi:hypothetical protein
MKSRLLCAACACLIGSNFASAKSVTWTLNNVVFRDGGTATGSFVFDANDGDVGSVSSWNVSVTGGDPGFPAFTYESDGNQFAGTYSDQTIDQYFSFNNLPPQNDTRLIRIGPSQPLTDAGGTVALALDPQYTNYNVEFVGSVPRGIISGSVSAVPLPAAFPLFAAGLFGLVVIARSRHAPVARLDAL